MSASTASAARSVVRMARHPRRPPESLEAVAPLDKRTRLGKDVAAFRAVLVQHCGGRPSGTQGALIEVALQLRIRLAAMDARFAETGEMSAHDSKIYLSWSNSIARVMRQLGLRGAPQRQPTLAEILATPHQPNTHARPASAAPGPVQPQAGASAPPSRQRPP